VIGLLLAINFSGRIMPAAYRSRPGQPAQEHPTLQAPRRSAELDYVDSDAFVEKWAQRGRMVKGDEMLVVLRGPGDARGPTVIPASSVTNSQTQNWKLCGFVFDRHQQTAIDLLLPPMTLYPTLLV
jgi:hypothetical protein